MSEVSLDDALTGTEAEPTGEVKVEPKADEAKDETPAGSEETTDAVPVSTDEAKLQAANRQAKSERQKRVKLEERLNTLEQSLQEKSERPSVLEDEEAAFDHEKQATTNQIQKVKFDLSRDFMIQQHDDYEELEEEFLEDLKGNKVLQDEVWNHPNPARFVYEKAQQARKLAEFEGDGDVQSQLIAMKKELDDLKGQLAGQESDDAKSIAAQPSLAESRSAGENSTPVEESLEQILKR